ncbi:hypothetical protein BG262_07875 [Floricoccus penangensis]|uniref:Pseudouridine synthase n=2 Tax=Floricoccus penangensis TaxID=1859475 RepID=A0A9Q5JIT1_9LACT|nr:hypothetical protein BG262_07875 [Floricoccus penangensis]
MRIDELIMKNFLLNKKETKKAIKEGLVTVDGKIPAKISQNVDSSVQDVIFRGEKVIFYPHKYYMLHKPVQTISANTDKKHETVFDLLENVDKSELYLVGRLDFWTSGLLLITDNGKLGRNMLNPESHVEKIYQVTTKEPLVASDVDKFAQGLSIDGDVLLKPAQLEITGAHHANVKISEGRNRQVRKMFLSTGKLVTELKRIKFGPLDLGEDLAPGQYRELTIKEVESLIPHFN